jgi:two-component system, cell cycle sensor histidine kinase and response regulator CckA
MSMEGPSVGREGHRAAPNDAMPGDAPLRLDGLAAELARRVSELEAENARLGSALLAAEEGREEADRVVRDLERTAALLDAALQSSPIGIALLDRDLRYLRVNEAIARITGIPLAAHPGRTLREVNPALNDGLEAGLRRVLATGEPFREMSLLREVASAPGQLRHLVLDVYPIRSRTGEMFGLGVAVVDTTDRLELLDQIHQSQKLEAVGRLAAGIAHDFNNLLTVIRSYCDLALLELSESEPGYGEMLEIRSAADRAASLARQMLGMSRKQGVIPKAIDLAEVIRELEPMLQRFAPQETVLDVRLDPSMGVVRVDPTNLEQVVMNLVINAVDAMPRGGRIALRARNATLDEDYCRRHADARPGEYVLLEVSDTGMGMSEETMRRIFEPFFTTKEPGRGTGLGLATVFGIVHHLGGHIGVESARDQGTTFSVYIPREVDGAADARREGLAERLHVPQGTETILLVEDEHALRASVERGLRHQGYTVLVASHGGEALRIAAEYDGAIDLLLTDLHMPGMDGRDLASRLRSMRSATRAVFMSGSSGPREPSQDADRFDRGFIPKPFAIDDLARLVREVLDTE